MLAVPEIVTDSFACEHVRFIIFKVLKEGFLFTAVYFKTGAVQKNCYNEVRL